MPKEQSKIDNLEKLATYVHKDEEKQKHYTISVEHKYTQKTNNLNKT